LIAFGALTRLASIVMIINFIVALVMVHVGQPFAANISPLAMLFCAIFFLLHGPDRSRSIAVLRSSFLVLSSLAENGVYSPLRGRHGRET
jgi:uncharacterized membrane protein YphA (DoxX/SURF4 family)